MALPVPTAPFFATAPVPFLAAGPDAVEEAGDAALREAVPGRAAADEPAGLGLAPGAAADLGLAPVVAAGFAGGKPKGGPQLSTMAAASSSGMVAGTKQGASGDSTGDMALKTPALVNDEGGVNSGAAADKDEGMAEEERGSKSSCCC